MYRIRGTIKGTAPILFNAWTKAELEALDRGGSTGKKTVEQREKEAYERLYKNGNGIFLPPWTFKKCLLEGTQKAGVKEGRGSLVPYLAAEVFVDGELLFHKEEPDFIHTTWGRRPPRTGAACIVRRPALEAGWEVSFTIVVMEDRRRSDHIKIGLEAAGLKVGLGSWRPEFGRFVIVDGSWQAEK